MFTSERITIFGDEPAVRFDTLLQNYLTASIGLLPAAITVTGRIFALDVACDSGQWVRMLAKSYPAWEAIGLTEQNLSAEYARGICLEEKIRNAYFTPGQPHDLPIQANLFDLVRGCNLMSRVPAEQWLPVLQEIVRVCCYGGRVVMQEVGFPVTNSPACLQMTDLAKAALARKDMSETMLTEMMRLFTLALSHEAVRTDIRLDLSYGTAAYKHLTAALPSLITCLQTSLMQMHVTTEQEMRQVIKGIIAEVHSVQFQGVQTVTTLIGEKVL